MLTRLQHAWNRLAAALPLPPLGTVAFNMRPVAGPWGGSSAFVTQFGLYLRRRGYRVTFRLTPDVDAIVLIDPRPDLQYKAFGMDEIIRFRREKPSVKIIHRVNECDLRKGSNFMDAQLRDANRHVDFTVFISAWLRDHHAQTWFDKAKPHAVVYNGADPRIFHAVGTTPYSGSGPFRIGTHHWADSVIKGYDVYQEIDRRIADGKLPGIQLVVIGRWPAGMTWRSAETHPPQHGAALADRLRSCHAYITASRWEPCGMHHVEGAQCGLPLLYHEDGGGINEAGERYGIGFRDDVDGAIAAIKDRYPALRRAVLERMPSGDRMCLEYGQILQMLLAGG